MNSTFWCVVLDGVRSGGSESRGHRGVALGREEIV